MGGKPASPAVLSRADAQSADGEDSFTAFRRLLKSMTRYVAASIAGDPEMAAQRADQLRTMASSLALSAPVEGDDPVRRRRWANADRPASPPHPPPQRHRRPHQPMRLSSHSQQHIHRRMRQRLNPKGKTRPLRSRSQRRSRPTLSPEPPAQGTEGSPPASTPDEPESPRNLFDMLRRAFDDARAAQSPDDKE
ncbi:MAG: hypothetical protein HND48_05405 [Chloroflexi bacterium]|nr:hypothetical protein [Chloroflexota bacterium]